MASERLPDILISEVGPRDGLQSIKRAMPTAAKLAWIRALAAAGLREIEVGSFVSPKLLPQMADAAEVVAGALAIEGLTVLALAPNLKGAERAFAAGAHKVTLPVSASQAHSLANINMTPDQAVEQVKAVVAMRNGMSMPQGRARPGVEIGISTAFGCTMEGQVPEDRVIALAVKLADAGADQIGLSDTTGMGNPAQVKRLFTRLHAELGDRAGGAHLHNTRGQGLANVVAALDVGVRAFDSSQGGLGGCPYAPGATGNIVTEDLVCLLETMGLSTGIDLDRLVAAREALLAGLPDEPLYGHAPAVGYPKGFAPPGGRPASASGARATSGTHA
jgi:hydroxymethylglutaryl-CoA lyase